MHAILYSSLYLNSLCILKLIFGLLYIHLHDLNGRILYSRLFAVQLLPVANLQFGRAALETGRAAGDRANNGAQGYHPTSRTKDAVRLDAGFIRIFINDNFRMDKIDILTLIFSFIVLKT